MHAAMAALWTTEQLADEHVRYLGSLSLKIETEDFTLVHGSPRDPVWEYVVSADSAQATFEDIGTTWCLVGHSHIPFVCRDSDNGILFTEAVPDSPVELSSEKLIINPVLSVIGSAHVAERKVKVIFENWEPARTQYQGKTSGQVREDIFLFGRKMFTFFDCGGQVSYFDDYLKDPYLFILIVKHILLKKIIYI